MSESRNHHFVFELLVLLCCISFQNVSGIQMKLTRRQNGDFFTNPYERIPYNFNFCISTNATCSFQARPDVNNKCRYCRCNATKATLNETNLRCGSIQDFGQGCRTKLGGNSIRRLDLTKDGEATLFTVSDKKVKSVRVISMNGMKVDFFRQKKDQVLRNGRGQWKVKIEWKNVPKKKYNGQVFRVQISYEIARNSKRNDCFVFKSKGTMTVNFPNFTTTTTLPSTTEKSSSTEILPSGVVSSTEERVTTTSLATTEYVTTTAQPTTKAGLIQTTDSTTDSVKTTVSASENSTPAISSSDQTKPSKVTRKPTSSASETEMSKFTPTNDAKKERRSGKENDGNNAVTVSLAVVGCLLLLGVVVLAVLWFRRRSSRTSKDKKNTELSFANGNVENPTVMSQPENIYAEAESTIYCSKNGEDNYEYDYADGNLKNYASLDMTKVDSKPVYQSLINVERDLNEHIPSDGGKTSTAEPFYHVVEGQIKEPSEIYHVLEESEETESREKPGRTGHDSPERVYSTLEEENAPENCDRDVLGRTGDDNPERVYSVLENEANLPASDTH